MRFFQPDKINLCSTLAIISLVGLQSPAKAVSISTYLSAPSSQSTIFAGTTTETFESLSPGIRTTDFVSVIGTYKLNATNRVSIQADNQYGSGTGNYMALGAQSGSSAPITLLLSSPASYFGFSWNAGDPNNGLSFYNGNTLVAKFSSSSVQNILSKPTVTALGGAVYNSSKYRGKPPTGSQNAGENYAFINFIATGGSFDRLVFDNSGSSGTGFESDNHTVLSLGPRAHSTFVLVGDISVAPEPGALPLAVCSFASFGAFATYRFKRRRHTVK